MPKLELVIQKRPRAWILTEKLLTVWRVINWFTTGLLLQVEASPYQHYCKEQYPWCCASYSGTMKGPTLYSVTLKVEVGYRRDQAFGFHTILQRVGFLSMKIVPLRWGGANQWWHGEQSQVTWLEAKNRENIHSWQTGPTYRGASVDCSFYWLGMPPMLLSSFCDRDITASARWIRNAHNDTLCCRICQAICWCMSAWSVNFDRLVFVVHEATTCNIDSLPLDETQALSHWYLPINQNVEKHMVTCQVAVRIIDMSGPTVPLQDPFLAL